MPDRPAPDVGLGHLVHLDSAHDARRHVHVFERVLQGERVNDRSQHAHLVRGDAVHGARGRGHAAKDIAATHHNAELHARPHHLLQNRDALVVVGVGPPYLRAGQLHRAIADPADGEVPADAHGGR